MGRYPRVSSSAQSRLRRLSVAPSQVSWEGIEPSEISGLTGTASARGRPSSCPPSGVVPRAARPGLALLGDQPRPIGAWCFREVGEFSVRRRQWPTCSDSNIAAVSHHVRRGRRPHEPAGEAPRRQGLIVRYRLHPRPAEGVTRRLVLGATGGRSRGGGRRCRTDARRFARGRGLIRRGACGSW